MLTEKKSILSYISTFRKFHPIALIMILSLMILSAHIMNLDVVIEEKIVPFSFSLFLYFFAVFFEDYRVNKQKEFEKIMISNVPNNIQRLPNRREANKFR